MGGTEVDDDNEGKHHHHIVLQSMLESGRTLTSRAYSKKMQLHLECDLCCFSSAKKNPTL